MEYSESYQLTRDIDWFFRTGERCIHVASNGGILPYFVNDIVRLRTEQATVALLENVKDMDVVVNEGYVSQRVAASYDFYARNGYDMVSLQELRSAYLSSFIAMALKGFYSYDRIPQSNAYMLICSPSKPITVGIQLLEADPEILFVEDDKSVFLVETLL